MKPVQIDIGAVADLRRGTYVMERKYDGWRALLIVNGRAKLWTRQRRRIEIPDSLQAAIDSLRLPPGTVLDGEIWNPVKRGGWKDPEGDGCRLTLWDCVRRGTEDVGSLPLERRREALESLVGEETGLVGMTSPVPASPEAVSAVLAEAKEARASGNLRSGFIHGVVLKRLGSPRRDHPTRSVEHADWLKVVFDGMKGWEPS